MIKTILLTGASGGLGTELVKFLINDYNVVCQYRKNDGPLRQIFGEKFDNHCFKAELTDETQVTELKKKVETFGPTWGIINLAGASSNSMSWKMSATQFKDAFSDNLLSTFLVSREFIPGMREQNAGRIINISSVIAFTGAIGASHYCAAKAGVVGLTKALALELANKNITVNALALGYFDRGLITQVPVAMQDDVRNRTPLKRFGHVHEMAGMIRYLLSDDGSFTTGQVHHINGGIHL
jgi:NAD(P)-dependent dehydrogenase (short-subunit alcohol dehydrogenase family)